MLPEDKKLIIVAWVFPLEEHLLHYLPLKVKKATLPESYNPLNFKDRFVNDPRLIGLSEVVYDNLFNGRRTILVLGGWSNYIESYEISDQQFLLARYISRVLHVCLCRLNPSKLQHLDVAIVGPVPQGGSGNLIQAPKYSLSLGRRLALTEMFSVLWSYFNPCGIMDEIINHNRRTPDNTFNLFGNTDKIITKSFAKILEVSFSRLICSIVSGNKPDISWQNHFKRDPHKLPNHLDIFNSDLDQQGLQIRKHCLSPTTLPLSGDSPGYPRLSSHFQLGGFNGSEDDESCILDPDNLASLPIIEEEESLHQYQPPNKLRVSTQERIVSKSPLPTSTSTLSSSVLQPKSTPSNDYIHRQRENSLQSRRDASESRPSSYTTSGPLRFHRESNTVQPQTTPIPPKKKRSKGAPILPKQKYLAQNLHKIRSNLSYVS